MRLPCKYWIEGDSQEGWLVGHFYFLPIRLKRGTVCFWFESKNRVATVLNLLRVRAHLSAQSYTMLMVSCNLCVAVDVYSSQHQTARSSTCRVLETNFEITDVRSFMYVRNRIWENTPPWGTTSLSLMRLLVLLSMLTLAVLW